MRVTLIIAILLSVLLTIFALANNVMTEVNYLFGSVDVPLSLLLLLCLALGVLIMFLFNIPSWWKNRQDKAALKKQIKQLEQQLEQANQAMSAPEIEVNEDFTNDVEKE